MIHPLNAYLYSNNFYKYRIKKARNNRAYIIKKSHLFY